MYAPYTRAGQSFCGRGGLRPLRGLPFSVTNQQNRAKQGQAEEGQSSRMGAVSSCCGLRMLLPVYALGRTRLADGCPLRTRGIGMKQATNSKATSQSCKRTNGTPLQICCSTWRVSSCVATGHSPARFGRILGIAIQQATVADTYAFNQRQTARKPTSSLAIPCAP